MKIKMNTDKKHRYYLVDILFAILLCGSLALDFFIGNWWFPHGPAFVFGLVCLVGIVITDWLSLRRLYALIVIAVLALAVLPLFDITGGDTTKNTLLVLVPISIALYTSVKTMLKHDRLQGFCGLILALWALFICVSNALNCYYRHTSYWTAEVS